MSTYVRELNSLKKGTSDKFIRDMIDLGRMLTNLKQKFPDRWEEIKNKLDLSEEEARSQIALYGKSLQYSSLDEAVLNVGSVAWDQVGEAIEGGLIKKN